MKGTFEKPSFNYMEEHYYWTIGVYSTLTSLLAHSPEFLPFSAVGSLFLLVGGEGVEEEFFGLVLGEKFLWPNEPFLLALIFSFCSIV